MAESSTPPSVQFPTPSQTPTASQPPKKKSNVVVILLILVFVLLLLCCACSAFLIFGTSRLSERIKDNVNQRFGKEIFENVIEDAVEEGFEENTGNDTDVDFNEDEDTVTWENEDSSGTYGDSTEWPTGLPVDLPEFTYADINAVVASEDPESPGWTMTFENPVENAVASYQADVVNAGWSVTATLDMGETDTFTAEKDTWGITCSCSMDSASCIVILGEAL